MRILVDENTSIITVHELREMRHDVPDIRGRVRQGMLVTTDKGFSEHRDEQHCGTQRTVDSRAVVGEGL